MGRPNSDVSSFARTDIVAALVISIPRPIRAPPRGEPSAGEEEGPIASGVAWSMEGVIFGNRLVDGGLPHFVMQIQTKTIFQKGLDHEAPMNVARLGSSAVASISNRSESTTSARRRSESGNLVSGRNHHLKRRVFSVGAVLTVWCCEYLTTLNWCCSSGVCRQHLKRPRCAIIEIITAVQLRALRANLTLPLPVLQENPRIGQTMRKCDRSSRKKAASLLITAAEDKMFNKRRLLCKSVFYNAISVDRAHGAKSRVLVLSIAIT